MGVAGLGDRPLAAALAGGALAGHQPQVGADRSARRSAASRRSRRPGRRRSAWRPRAGRRGARRPPPRAALAASIAIAASRASRRARTLAQRPGLLVGELQSRARRSAGAASQRSWACVQAEPSQTSPWRRSSLQSRWRARIRSPRASSRARTRSRAASSAGARDAHRSELAEAQQLGQPQGVAAVGLDALAGRPGDLRGRGHQAGDAGRRAGAREAEAGGPGLVGDGERLALLAQPGRRAPRCAPGRSQLRTSPLAAVEHPGRDRPCVHVETDERKLTHAAPPRKCGSATTLRGGNPRQLTWWGAAPLHTV